MVIVGWRNDRKEETAMQQALTKPTRIVVIGVGAVGSTTAYTLLLRNRMSELVLIDFNRKKAEGDALDMNHGLPFIGGVKVWAGDYSDCRDADIIIIAAGVAQKLGETRLDLLKRNAFILGDIIDQIKQYNQHAILLIATNPVDILSYVCWKRSGWPSYRVIGSGTLLDTARFRYLIGKEIQVDPRSIHAHIIGEHGDSELPVWSSANIAGAKLDLEESEKERIFSSARNAAYQIIEAKGATYYAIALAIDRIVEAILKDESCVLNVSTLLEGYHGISDVYIGVPCVVNRSGVREVINLPLTEEEVQLLRRSADLLKEQIQQLEIS
jgi:L-lactate dehydrogenase